MSIGAVTPSLEVICELGGLNVNRHIVHYNLICTFFFSVVSYLWQTGMRYVGGSDTVGVSGVHY